MTQLHVYLQSLNQLFPSGDVGNVDGCAESVQHLHFLKNVSATGGSDDQQLPTLRESDVQTCQLTPTHTCTAIIERTLRGITQPSAEGKQGKC